MASTVEQDMQVFHWRDGSWSRIEWDSWASFRGGKSRAPLPHVRAGEHYFLVCVIEGDRLFQIHPHRYLIDADGRIGKDHYFGVLSNIEAERYEALDKRYYAYPQIHPLTDQERREFDAIRERLWQSWLPSPGAVRELMRALRALPNEDDAAWHVLEASGLSRTFGQA
jgi:hypothetical protein